jgi:hypothetical protein
MKQILVMVGKDGRRMKWWVALFLAVNAVKFGVGWWLTLGGAHGFATWGRMGDAVKWLVVAEVVLTWLIAGALVLEDPLVGAQAAWRTRPISAGRLFAAKAVGALLWLWGPSVLLGLPWWWASGFGVGDVLRAMAMGLATTVAVIAPSFFVASLVDSMGRYVLWSIPGFAGVFVVPMATKLIAERLPGGGAWWSLGAVAALFAAAGYLVRFRSDNAGRVFRGAAFGTVAVLAAVGCWLVVRFNGPGPKWTESNAAVARDVKISWRETRAVDQGKREPFTSVSSWFTAEGVPAGLALDAAGTRHEWTREGGAPITARGEGYATNANSVRSALGLPLEITDPETERWQEARQREREAQRALPRVPKGSKAGSTASEHTLIAYSGVLPSVGAQLRTVATGYRVSAELRVVRAVEWANVPLRVGASEAREGHGVRVVSSTAQDQGRALAIVEARALPWNFVWEYNQGRWRRPTYYGLDRESGRLVRFHSEVSPSVLIGGVELQAQTGSVDAPKVIRDGKLVLLDPQWAERMRLVLLRWDEVARITREARTENFVVTP